MKRKLVAMMLCVLVVSIFGGCGLFTSSDSDEGTGEIRHSGRRSRKISAFR